jgi:hypothetical protein
VSNLNSFSIEELEAMYANVRRHGNENTPAGRALMDQIVSRRRANLGPLPGYSPAASPKLFGPAPQGVLAEPNPEPIDENSGWEMIRMFDQLRGY